MNERPTKFGDMGETTHPPDCLATTIRPQRHCQPSAPQTAEYQPSRLGKPWLFCIGHIQGFSLRRALPEIVEAVKVDPTLELERDLSRWYDEAAVLVRVARTGHVLGYLDTETALAVAPELDAWRVFGLLESENSTRMSRRPTKLSIWVNPGVGLEPALLVDALD